MNTPHDPLDQDLKEHYEAQSLGDDALARLRATVGEVAVVAEDRTAASSWSGSGRRGLIAASVAIAVLVGLGWHFLWSADEWPARARSAAEEIGVNHRKGAEPSFEVSSYGALMGRLPRLDFTPVAPAEMPRPGLRLMGARYCSVDDAIACQLSLVDEAGRRYTLYQWRSSGAEDEEATTFDIAGTSVTVWREGDVLLALAGP